MRQRSGQVRQRRQLVDAATRAVLPPASAVRPPADSVSATAATAPPPAAAARSSSANASAVCWRAARSLARAFIVAAAARAEIAGLTARGSGGGAEITRCTVAQAVVPLYGGRPVSRA